MTPTNFDGENFTFTAPEGMTNEQCGDLPVFRGKDNYGYPSIVSCWELSPEELEQVKETGKVYLNICAVRMPPAVLMTYNPVQPVKEKTAEPINEDLNPEKSANETNN